MKGNILKKELGIYLALFIFLALGMHHKEWLSHPIEHAMGLPHAGAYGFGALHPFIFALIVYLVIGLFRLIAKAFSAKKEEK